MTFSALPPAFVGLLGQVVQGQLHKQLPCDLGTKPKAPWGHNTVQEPHAVPPRDSAPRAAAMCAPRIEQLVSGESVSYNPCRKSIRCKHSPLWRGWAGKSRADLGLGGLRALTVHLSEEGSGLGFVFSENTNNTVVRRLAERHRQKRAAAPLAVE